MRPLPEILAKIDSATERYETKQLGLISDQAEILRDLSVALHFLVPHKIEAHTRWLEKYYEHKGSNPQKERHADKEVPELYMIRHFLNSGYKVMESLRSTISANKN